METAQLNKEKYKLIEGILSIDSMDILNKMSKYFNRIKKPVKVTENKRQSTKEELEYLLSSFKNDEIAENDILCEVKQVRQQRYEKRSK
jgi:hypothetical protein